MGELEEKPDEHFKTIKYYKLIDNPYTGPSMAPSKIIIGVIIAALVVGAGAYLLFTSSNHQAAYANPHINQSTAESIMGISGAYTARNATPTELQSFSKSAGVSTGYVTEYNTTYNGTSGALDEHIFVASNPTAAYQTLLAEGQQNVLNETYLQKNGAFNIRVAKNATLNGMLYSYSSYSYYPYGTTEAQTVQPSKAIFLTGVNGKEVVYVTVINPLYANATSIAILVSSQLNLLSRQNNTVATSNPYTGVSTQATTSTQATSAPTVKTTLQTTVQTTTSQPPTTTTSKNQKSCTINIDILQPNYGYVVVSGIPGLGNFTEADDGSLSTYCGTQITLHAISNVSTRGAFVNWTCTGTNCYSGTIRNISFMLNSTITEIATFSLNKSVKTSTLTIYNNCPSCGYTSLYGSSSGSTYTYPYGTELNITEYPNTGYIAAGWNGSGSAGIGYCVSKGSQLSTRASCTVFLNDNVSEYAYFQPANTTTNPTTTTLPTSTTTIPNSYSGFASSSQVSAALSSTYTLGSLSTQNYSGSIYMKTQTYMRTSQSFEPAQITVTVGANSTQVAQQYNSTKQQVSSQTVYTGTSNGAQYVVWNDTFKNTTFANYDYNVNGKYQNYLFAITIEVANGTEHGETFNGYLGVGQMVNLTNAQISAMP